MQSSDQIIEQQKPQEVNLSPNPQWIYTGNWFYDNGHYEWTGDKLDNIHIIPFNLKDKVKFVTAPNATIVIVRAGHKLRSIKAPNATELQEVGDCWNLESIEAPKATKVHLFGCPKLKSLELTNAMDVYLSNCGKEGIDLEGIEVLPKAERVHLQHCVTLKSFKAPEATDVTLDDCVNLEGIEVPKATIVNLSSCGKLESFKAPDAKIVKLDNCGNLKSFDAPSARQVNLSSCVNLESFKAPDATIVKLDNCGNLKSFDAPKAMRVHLHPCAKLESFEAPNATEVYLDNCVNLKSFNAPNVTQIVLRNPPKDLVDTIIGQLNNPQTLTKFEVNGTDITQYIKNADMGLNRKEYVSNLRAKIVSDMRPGGGGSYQSKRLKQCEGAWLIIGSFLDPQTIQRLSTVNKKAQHGSSSETCTSNLQAIKYYKKQHIVARTRENAQASGINF